MFYLPKDLEHDRGFARTSISNDLHLLRLGPLRYESWLKCHVLPRWGAHVITDVQPRDVELWLISLPLAPKSKAEVRASLGRLWDFAMWSGNVPVQRKACRTIRRCTPSFFATARIVPAPCACSRLISSNRSTLRLLSIALPVCFADRVGRSIG
jgi:hypothetical protein